MIARESLERENRLLKLGPFELCYYTPNEVTTPPPYTFGWGGYWNPGDVCVYCPWLMLDLYWTDPDA